MTWSLGTSTSQVRGTAFPHRHAKSHAAGTRPFARVKRWRFVEGARTGPTSRPSDTARSARRHRLLPKRTPHRPGC